MACLATKPISHPMTRALLLLLTLALLAGCATTGDEHEDDERTAASLYRDAKEALDAGDYETAISRLESLEARFPFGRFAQQAQLDIAYAYYKFEEPESAIAAADRFIKLYPRHPRVDYAYYIRGVIKFNQGRSVFDKLPSQDPAKRDPGAARQAFAYFSELVQRFPDSDYAEDAIQRMIYLRNQLARHELYVAEFYMKREAYLAAANRAKYVIETFQRAPATADALALLVRAYRKLELPRLAADSLRVLELNYPDSPQLARLTRTLPDDSGDDIL